VVLLAHTQVLPGGVPVLAAPLHAGEATALASDAARLLWPRLAVDGDVVVLGDVGRCVAPGVPVTLASASLVVVAVRQNFRSAPATVARLTYARQLVEELAIREQALAVVLTGAVPYPPGEVARFLGVELAGVLDEDAGAAAWLSGRRGSPKASGRSRLLRSARRVATRLAGRLEPTPVPPPPVSMSRRRRRRVDAEATP
jgi:hypothetical protein